MKPSEITADKLSELENMVAHPVLDSIQSLEGTEIEGYPGVIASVLIRLGGTMLLEIAPDEDAFRSAIVEFAEWVIEDAERAEEKERLIRAKFREAEQSEAN